MSKTIDRSSWTVGVQSFGKASSVIKAEKSASRRQN